MAKFNVIRIIIGLFLCCFQGLICILTDHAPSADAHIAMLSPAVSSGPNPIILEVAGGFEHSCALMATGEVKCWGSNRYGQLGNGAMEKETPFPVKVPGVKGAVEISVFGFRTCAVLNTGKTCCWGAPLSEAQPGPPHSMSRFVPTFLDGIENAIDVSVGGDYVCVLLSKGDIRCVVSRVKSKTGGKGLKVSKTISVGGIGDATELAGGSNEVCALRRNGEVWCWKAPTFVDERDDSESLEAYQMQGVESACKIASGDRHFCVLGKFGSVQCWGYNSNGQVGDVNIGGYVTAPIQMKSLRGAVDIAAGKKHTCALSSSGRVVCWGSNWAGQLGRTAAADPGADFAGPAMVSFLTDIRALGAGTAHTCAVDEIGKVSCWGLNESGQLGKSQMNPPTAVTGISNAVDVAAGGEGGLTCVRTALGNIICWGGGKSTPQIIESVSGAIDVSAGLTHACAVDDSGDVWCWGKHVAFVHHGDRPFVYGDGVRPEKVEGVSKATQVAAGVSHTCALLSKGTVVCWGAGAIGNGKTAYTDRPIKVDGLKTVVHIAAGQNKNYAILKSGIVLCWGECGEIGPEWQYTPVPVPIPGIRDAKKASAASHACVLRKSGRVTCLGNNEYGLLGNGASGSNLRQVNVSGLDAVEVSVGLHGGGFSCAVRKSGKVACWGDNRSGQLGDGTKTPRTTPVNVQKISGALKVSAGGGHACAVLETGSVMCWGENALGQLGTENAESKLAIEPKPVVVQGLRDYQ